MFHLRHLRLYLIGVSWDTWGQFPEPSPFHDLTCVRGEGTMAWLGTVNITLTLRGYMDKSGHRVTWRPMRCANERSRTGSYTSRSTAREQSADPMDVAADQNATLFASLSQAQQRVQQGIDTVLAAICLRST